MPISLETWGNYACFTRPEMKTERVSYDIMTPSAARGLLESVYWHPGMRWVIDRIHVCAPIRFTNLRRNEVKSTISARSVRTVMERGEGELYLVTSQDIQQRAAMLLRDVRYVIAPISILQTGRRPATTPANSRTSSSAGSNGDSFITNPALDAGSFPPSSRRARPCRPARRS